MYTLVAPMNVDTWWPAVAPMISQAIFADDPGEDLAIIKHKAGQGVAQIWIGQKPQTSEIDFVMVTEGMVLDDIPTCVVRWLTATNLNDKIVDFGLLERWAFHQGYRRLQVWGRRGWERKLRPLGFVHDFSVMNKFIEKGLH